MKKLQVNTSSNKVMIEQRAYDNFRRDFDAGKFGTQRLGQAFYDTFKLYRMVNQSLLQNIYAKDGQHAVNCIAEICEFN